MRGVLSRKARYISELGEMASARNILEVDRVNVGRSRASRTYVARVAESRVYAPNLTELRKLPRDPER